MQRADTLTAKAESKDLAMDKKSAQNLVDSHSWWYHRFEIFPGIVTPGVYDPSYALASMNLPESMSGMRVLEIGPCDGYFTKMLADRGANVTAVDYAKKGTFGFHVMEQLQGKKLDWRCANIYELEQFDFEPFDYVLCLGVLYHLPDMMKALWILRGLTKGVLYLETLVSRKHENEPFAEYLPGATHNNDYTNFWAPNTRCLEAMLNDAGFTVHESRVAETRALFRMSVAEDPSAGNKVRVAYSRLER
jgi:tRNA (mo5U34)-methyltransferase